MNERDLPEYVTPAELLEVVGDDLEALCWLRSLIPQNKADAADFYRKYWPDVLRGFEEMRQRFEGGESAALLEAIETAASVRVPLPEWIADGFKQAWGRYTEAEARTLGESFGVERPKGWNQTKNRQLGYMPLIQRRFEALTKAGLKTGLNAGPRRTVYEQIAAELADPEMLADKNNPAPDPEMAALFAPTPEGASVGGLKPLHVSATWVRDNRTPEPHSTPEPDD
ncbi:MULTISPECIES: hypothetical protein [unclassified Thioalkalivibrio]|uniref:hypothetical protein n=1 Tax=unclassified Thioalkalivibrio TaxID=2621013 RepID=UPI00035E5B09|nr:MULTISPECIES: hypothetical protein [unclassified Thioalkalivibrio]